MKLNIEQCPKNRKDRTKTLQFYPEGIGEIVNVEVQYICDCKCQIIGDELGQAVSWNILSFNFARLNCFFRNALHKNM